VRHSYRREFRRTCFVAALTLATAIGQAGAPPGETAAAKQILAASGVRGGLVVHLGCGDGRLTAALAVRGVSSRRDPAGRGRPAHNAYLVHGLDTDPANVQKASAHIRSLGLYGPVSVELLRGGRLPYADNLVNLLVADNLGKVPMAEVTRVLAPRGVAMIGGRKTVKPWPADIDEWTHWLHDASGNAVARDRAVGPPKHVQWIAPPRWQRHHELNTGTTAFVSAGGRIFYTDNEAPATAEGLPDRWVLVARDGFSGVLLWKRPIADWGWKAWSTREPGGRFNLPIHVARRLVAVGDRVYFTLGFNAPVTALDAATGKTVRTYDGTRFTDEILHHDGLLVLSINKGPQKPGRIADKPPVHKQVAVLKADTGETLWRRGDFVGISTKSDVFERITHLGLAVGDGKIFFLEEDAVVCLDLATGRELWRSPRPEKHTRQGHLPYKPANLCTLVAHDDVLLFAQAEEPYSRKTWNRGVKVLLTGLSTKTGRKLWTHPCSKWGPGVEPGVFVVGGLVWVQAADELALVALDPHSGEVKRRFSTKAAFNEVHHHRCFRNKATDRYLLTARRGIEFIDLKSGQSLKHHWVRGACRYGIVPANGLVYVPPHPCQCYIRVKLSGFFALAPAREGRGSGVEGRGTGQAKATDRLVRGPAFSAIANRKPQIANATAWPTYRHDAARSGSTDAQVPVHLRLAWQARLGGGRVSACTVADGKVFVACVDQHRVCALDAADGKLAWDFVAGGRVDTPPTLHEGLALFGSADGWVYALRASDGELAWRFRAAPEERRIVAFGQVESPWPVHGTVLVQDGVAYVAAGRSTHLDGGIKVYALNPRTGQVLRELKPLNADPHGLEDVLVSDGRLVYMRQLAFSLKDKGAAPKKGLRRAGAPRAFSTAGLLDDTCFCRVGWPLGNRARADLAVFDERAVYAFGTKRHGGFGGWFKPGTGAYQVTARERKTGKQLWKLSRAPRVRAMVLAGPTLFVAGSPDVVDPKDPWAAVEGRDGGVLRALSARDGSTLGKWPLEAAPAWDGLAAAAGRLYLSTSDGRVMCFAGKEKGR